MADRIDKRWGGRLFTGGEGYYNYYQYFKTFFGLTFNSFQVLGRVPWDWIRKSLLFRCICESGAPILYFTDARSILGALFGQPLGENAFSKNAPQKPTSSKYCKFVELIEFHCVHPLQSFQPRALQVHSPFCLAWHMCPAPGWLLGLVLMLTNETTILYHPKTVQTSSSNSKTLRLTLGF